MSDLGAQLRRAMQHQEDHLTQWLMTVESGHVIPTAAFVRKVLELYKVDKAEVDAIVEMLPVPVARSVLDRAEAALELARKCEGGGPGPSYDTEAEEWHEDLRGMLPALLADLRAAKGEAHG